MLQRFSLCKVHCLYHHVGLDTEGKRTLSLQWGEREAISFSDATIYSFEDLLAITDSDFTVPYYLRLTDAVISDGYKSSFIKMPKNIYYAFADVTDYSDGDELIIKDHKITVFGKTDGYVVPLYDETITTESGNVRYVAAEKTLYWPYGGKMKKMVYDEEKQAWSVIDTGVLPWEDELFFARWGEDYYVALAEHEGEVQAEIEAEADRKMILDDSMIITAPVEDYAGLYEKNGRRILIKGVSDDSMTIQIDPEYESTGVAFGPRYTEFDTEVPEQVAVYVVSGSVRSSINDVYAGRKEFPVQCIIALKPDGNILINNKNLSNVDQYKLEEGTWTRIEN